MIMPQGSWKGCGKTNPYRDSGPEPSSP